MASSTLTLTPDDALSVLEYWHMSAERLMLVFRRAEECVTRIGCGRVRNATAREAWMDTNHGHLHVMLHSAAFEFGKLAHAASACLHEVQEDGLLICVDIDDWIFLRSSPALLSGRRAQGKLMLPPREAWTPRLTHFENAATIELTSNFHGNYNSFHGNFVER